MKLFHKAKDGGPKSTVTGYWLIEAKKLFSIALLKFDDGSREEYHSHAFHSLNFILKGRVREERLGKGVFHHKASLLPILTLKSTFHRVFSDGVTWVLTFRGPWDYLWKEYSPKDNVVTVLGHGRKVVDDYEL